MPKSQQPGHYLSKHRLLFPYLLDNLVWDNLLQDNLFCDNLLWNKFIRITSCGMTTSRVLIYCEGVGQ